MRWEQEQMRRGGHTRDIPTEQQMKPTYKAAPSQCITLFTYYTDLFNMFS